MLLSPSFPSVLSLLESWLDILWSEWEGGCRWVESVSGNVRKAREGACGPPRACVPRSRLTDDGAPCLETEVNQIVALPLGGVRAGQGCSTVWDHVLRGARGSGGQERSECPGKASRSQSLQVL